MKRRAFVGLGAGAAGGVLLSGWSAARAQAAASAKVLIIGGGFAGSSCALQLRRLNPRMQVTLVDPDEIYTTCPMSNGALVGQRAMQSLRVTRRGLARSGAVYVRDQVVALDMRGRRARLAGGGELSFDRVVLATGIRMVWGKVSGYTETAALRMPHAWQAGTQTEILAAQIRALPDGGVMAISVPAGPMRCPPGPFERASLIAAHLRAAKPRCKILIFDANNRFPRQDEFTGAWQALYPGMIEWISVVDGGAVERVDPERMTVVSAAGEHRVDIANIIPPQAPALLAVQAGLASDHGWCPVNPLTFASTAAEHAYVIGDSCIADPYAQSRIGCALTGPAVRGSDRCFACGARAQACDAGQRLLQFIEPENRFVDSRPISRCCRRHRASAGGAPGQGKSGRRSGACR